MIRSDNAEAAPHIAVIVRAVNTLLISRRKDLQFVQFPRDGVTYRGGGLPHNHKAFFQCGTKYRVPGFLATSFSQQVADRFMLWADQRGENCVLWIIHVDPEGEHLASKRCLHVNYVEHRALGVPLEEEYLFAPYAPFTVRDVCAPALFVLPSANYVCVCDNFITLTKKTKCMIPNDMFYMLMHVCTACACMPV